MGANSISSSSTIQLVFNNAVDASTVNGNNILILGDKTGEIAGTFSGGGTATITFTPSANYQAGEQIWVGITTGLTSSSTSLSADETFTFSVTSGSWPSTSGSNPIPLHETDLNTSSEYDYENIKTVDLDSDGDLDIVANRWNDELVWYENTASGSREPFCGNFQ